MFTRSGLGSYTVKTSPDDSYDAIPAFSDHCVITLKLAMALGSILLVVSRRTLPSNCVPIKFSSSRPHRF